MPLPITDAPPKEHSPKRAGVARGSKHEIKEFLVSYNKLRNRKFRATHDASPDKARKLIGNEHLQEKAAQGCVTRGLRRAAKESQPPRPLCSRSLLRQFDPGLHPVVPENPIRLGFARRNRIRASSRAGHKQTSRRR
jgi:hypothetical protein